MLGHSEESMSNIDYELIHVHSKGNPSSFNFCSLLSSDDKQFAKVTEKGATALLR